MMIKKYKNIGWMAIMLLGVFLSVNWIYGRTQLSGWMPLPFSIMILVGSAYQVYDLAGKISDPTTKFTRKLFTVATLLLLTVSFSALWIFYVLHLPKNDPKYDESIAPEQPYLPKSTYDDIVVPERSLILPEPIMIYVRKNNYRIDVDATEGAVADLEALIARYKELTLDQPENRVVISAESDVSYSRVVEVMSALTTIGASNISLATKGNKR